MNPSDEEDFEKWVSPKNDLSLAAVVLASDAPCPVSGRASCYASKTIRLQTITQIQDRASDAANARRTASISGHSRSTWCETLSRHSNHLLKLIQVDDVSSAFSGPDAEAANSTPWTVKHIKESSPFIVRAFKRLTEQGY